MRESCLDLDLKTPTVKDIVRTIGKPEYGMVTLFKLRTKTSVNLLYVIMAL